MLPERLMSMRRAYRLSIVFQCALAFAACLALHVSAAPQTDTAAAVAAEDDHVFERGSGEPYNPQNNINKMRDMYRDILLNMDEAKIAEELNALEPEQRAQAEKRLVRMREESVKVRVDEEAQTRLAQANWIKGPKTISLAEGITLNLPDGVKYLAPEDVMKTYAADARPPANKTLAYIHALDDRWKGTLALLDTGVIDTSNAAVLRDPAATLERLKQTTAHRIAADRQLLAQSSALLSMQSSMMRWVVAPEYDPALQRLEWASSNGGLSGGKQVEYNLFQLGKAHTAMMTVNSQDATFAADEILAYRPAIRQVMAGIVFAPGDRHADARADDPVSQLGIEHLVFGPPTEFEKRMQAIAATESRRQEYIEGKKNKLLWYLVGLGFVVAVVLVLRTRPEPVRQAQAPHDSSHAGAEDGKYAQQREHQHAEHDGQEHVTTPHIKREGGDARQ